MAVIRAFIAIDLPASVSKQLDDVIRTLQQRCGSSAVRWVPAKNVHLTLKFLGEVSSSNLEVLTRLLKSEAARHRCFNFTVGGLGAFPSLRRPRVIWVGVQAPANLVALQRSIEGETVRLGYVAEERSFAAHLTLGRVSHNASPEEVRRIGEQIATFTVGELGVVPVDKVTLFRSDLQPGGAVYTPLIAAPLTHA